MTNRLYRSVAVAAVLSSMIAGASGTALAAPGDLEALTKASDLDPDPADAKAVAAVCTACHSSAQFLTAARPYLRWEQTMQDMLDRGAVATDEQLDHVLSYLVKNITIVNVNSSPPDQLGMTLQIPSAVAEEIVTRRTAHAFTSVDELKAVKGVNLDVIQKLNAKKLIAF
jgi:DNA uptake protein ComE-like DNA-binding protein